MEARSLTARAFHGTTLPFTRLLAGPAEYTGMLFTARRGEREKEFLASTDPWFRPCNFTVGPDGSLYIMDMYRQHIESPESIPEDLRHNAANPG